jgi:hypothetical protein
VDIIEIATGSGFQFTIVPGRGLDIARASYKGIPLCWRSRAGEANAAFFEPDGLGWLWGAFGGLMSTGGLTTMGSPSVDQGQALGIHGRASYIPASNVWADADWEGERYRLWVRGKVVEAAALGPDLALTREISTEMGASHVVIRDTVENRTHQRVEHMMLYHFNIGFPVLSETARLLVDSKAVTPRDSDSAAGLERWDRFDAPLAGRPHQLFYHEVRPDSDGKAHAVLVGMQQDQPLAVYLSYTHTTLPWLVNWKCMQAGDYVTGIEPANAWVEGRAVEREAGRLSFLEPWEKVSYAVEFGVLAGKDEINAFVARHHLPDAGL